MASLNEFKIANFLKTFDPLPLHNTNVVED